MIRNVTLTLFFGLLLSGATAGQGSDQIHTYDVEGMTCALCSKAIDKSLRSVEGVEDVSIDEHIGRVSVTTSSDVEPALLKRSIESAGSYTATRVAPTDD